MIGEFARKAHEHEDFPVDATTKDEVKEYLEAKSAHFGSFALLEAAWRRYEEYCREYRETEKLTAYLDKMQDL